MHSASAMPNPIRGRSLPVTLALLLTFSLPMFAPLAAAQGEDGTVAVTSPTSGQSVTYYTSSTPLTIKCTTSKTPQADPEFGVGMAFAVRQAGVGGFDFSQGWDSTSPYEVTRTMAQWGISNTGNHEVRCRVYNGGVYYWATRTFNVVAAPSGEDGSVTMTSPTSGQSVTYYTSSTPLTISCTTTHTPQADPEFGAAGMAFAVRQSGVGGFDFNQGWDSTTPYSATRTMAQWGISNTGNHEARCRVHENGLYYWSTRTFNVVAAPSGEDGSVTMTSPSSGQSVSGSTLTVTCTTTHTPQADPEFGAAGMAFAVRPAGSGSFNFGQGWDGTSPYSVTQSMAQWGVTGPGSYEARCRVHENGLYHWSTRTFTVTSSDTLTGCTFTTTNNGLAVTATVDGTCQSSYGSPIAFSWDWGDGTTSPNAGSAPTHTYGAAYCPSGTATITLTATATGPSATSTRTVTVVDSTDADTDGLVACQEEAPGQGTSDDDPDTDRDGLTDDLEWAGHADRKAIFCPTPTSPDAACAYPHPTQRDLYIELEWQTGYGLSNAVLDDVRATYADSPLATDIHVVIDTGQLGGGGANLGAAGVLTWADVQASQDANMAPERQGIFHYGAIACRDGEGRGGRGEAPGDRFVLYFGNDATCVGQNADARKAAVFLHELGHNLLGWRRDASGGDDAARTCPLWDAHVNDLLNGDFAHVRDTRDCDGHGTGAAGADLWSHSIRDDDAMWGGGLDVQDDYRGTTWDALRLDLAVGPSAPTCGPGPKVGVPAVDDLLGTATALVADCATEAVPHGDLPAPHGHGAHGHLPHPALLATPLPFFVPGAH